MINPLAPEKIDMNEYLLSNDYQTCHSSFVKNKEEKDKN